MPTPPPLPPTRSHQDIARALIVATIAVCAILAILAAAVTLVPLPRGAELGADSSSGGSSDDDDPQGTAGSGRRSERSEASDKLVSGANPVETVNSVAVTSEIETKPHNGESGGAVANQVNEAASTTETIDSAAENNEGKEDVSRPTTRNFFTLDSNRGEPTTGEATERGPGERVDIQDLLGGRGAEAKGDLLRDGGGTSATEGAVKLGLEWLARNQQSNGLWSLQGPYDDGGMGENVAAATAMALLAFQGAGHTHKGDPGDPYTAVVARGSAALIEHIRTEGKSYRNFGLHGGYTQALCTIALCELFGMTRDSKLKKPVQDAVDYCIDAQSAEGGWRYAPRQDSDTSVTGWFVLALQSARMAGVKVPGETFGKVNEYLNSAGSGGGSRYGYQQGTVATRSMTAEGLLCRQYLGWKQNDPRLLDGADYLMDELPSWESPDVYYWYYATQVFHHLGGARWDRWNGVMREVLPSQQVTAGPDRGSWKPVGDIHAHAGGRLYVTCMCLYMLEVYYRHLPIYQESGAPAQR